MVAPSPPNILVIDDNPYDRKLLEDILSDMGMSVVTASDGPRALEILDRDSIDLVLLDVILPGMDGYQICSEIRSRIPSDILPIILITALSDAEDRIKGLDAGADDFLPKPIRIQELSARVRSLLRVKSLYDTVQKQAKELADWNQTLEKRVLQQVYQLEQLGNLSRFLPKQVAELILNSNTTDPLQAHRRMVTAVFVDLRGFTSFSENVHPDHAMEVVREYHEALGKLVMEHNGTLERFVGDGMMVLFNDPVPVKNAADRAVKMAMEMRDVALALSDGWLMRGIDLGVGFGLATGETTIGGIGFDERWDYGAIGMVPNLAARLCGEAKHGEVLVDEATRSAVSSEVIYESMGEPDLKGFATPVSVHRVVDINY
ncbi:MAG: response regulator [Candidatus Sedimenticola sp. PURPLELP]